MGHEVTSSCCAMTGMSQGFPSAFWKVFRRILNIRFLPSLKGASAVTYPHIGFQFLNPASRMLSFERQKR